MLLGAGHGHRLREPAIAMLLQREPGERTGQLAPHDGYLVLPGVVDQLDVLQVPIVVDGPAPGGPRLGRRLALQPDAEGIGRLAGALEVRFERRVRTRHLCREGRPGGTLLAPASDPHDPQVPGVLDQVASGLVQQRGNGLELRTQLDCSLRRERELVGPQLDAAERMRALAGRLVALRGKDGDVERRVPGPRAMYPVVELEAVHLGPY